jgi:hypothetical protein
VSTGAVVQGPHQAAPELRLRIDPLWLRANKRVLLVVIPALVTCAGTLSEVTYFIVYGVPGSRLEAVVLAGCVVLLAVLLVPTFDVSATRALRFRGNSDRWIVATAMGVSGEVYPRGWYQSKPKHDARLTGMPDSAVVIRSRILHRIVEVASSPNFVAWTSATAVVGVSTGRPTLRFLSRHSWRESQVFTNVICTVGLGDLPRLVWLAGLGGGDVHVDTRLLSVRGREAAVVCPRHDVPSIKRPPGVTYLRLRSPSSTIEGEGWFVNEVPVVADSHTGPVRPSRSRRTMAD